jgi:hypothetical protein
MRVKQYKLVVINHFVMIVGIVLCSMRVEQYDLEVHHMVSTVENYLHKHTYSDGGGGGGGGRERERGERGL